MTRLILKFSLVLSLIVLMAAPAFAQSRKELAAQNIALTQRLERLESRLLTGDPAAERLMVRVDALETAQRTLRGEVERLTYERDTLKEEVTALTQDLRGMQALFGRIEIHLDAVDLVAQETARRQPAAPVYTGPTSPISQIPQAPEYREQELVFSNPNPTNDVSELGQLGKTALAEGNYAEAQTAFSQYLQFNGSAPDVGEIHYWLGESYFVQGRYSEAAKNYIEAMRKDGQGVKAPDAMVRLGASLREMGQRAEACTTLASFPTQYPNAPQVTRDRAAAEAARTGC